MYRRNRNSLIARVPGDLYRAGHMLGWPDTASKVYHNSLDFQLKV